jgi:hypothetical protein
VRVDVNDARQGLGCQAAAESGQGKQEFWHVLMVKRRDGRR